MEEQLIREYLKNSKTKMLQLATSKDNQPWLCNVWFAADEDLNIYWFSSTTRRHSQEVAANSKVAGTICDPQNQDDTPMAIQFQGMAELLTDEADIAKARSVYEGRIFDAEAIDKYMANPDFPHRFYRITVELFVLFDPVHFPDISRREWKPNAQSNEV